MSMGHNPILQLAKAARHRRGWRFRSGRAVHDESGYEVIPNEANLFIVAQYPNAGAYFMPSNAMAAAEQTWANAQQSSATIRVAVSAVEVR